MKRDGNIVFHIVQCSAICIFCCLNYPFLLDGFFLFFIQQEHCEKLVVGLVKNYWASFAHKKPSKNDMINDGEGSERLELIKRAEI